MGRSAGQSEWSPELNREDCEQRGRELGVVGSRLMVAVAGCVSRCDFEGGVSSCPSQDAVGEMLGGVRRESVNRAVRLLQESGQLAVRKTRAPGARWPHNEYTLLVGCEVRQHRLPVLLWWESRRKRIRIEQWRLAHRSSRRCVPRRGACTTRGAASGSGVSHMERTARGFEEGRGALKDRTGGTGALKVSTGGRVVAEFRDRPVENRIRAAGSGWIRGGDVERTTRRTVERPSRRSCPCRRRGCGLVLRCCRMGRCRRSGQQRSVRRCRRRRCGGRVRRVRGRGCERFDAFCGVGASCRRWRLYSAGLCPFTPRTRHGVYARICPLSSPRRSLRPRLARG
jgi:hypothetical protein